MPSPQDGKPPGPDEIDRGLREILEGVGGGSALREPSAAERAATPARPRKLGRGRWRRWNGRRRPGKLGRPVRGSGGPASGGIRRRKLGLALRWAGILLLFAALLYGLHVLGFGPQ